MAERQFSPEELATFDGKEGRPAYVAYQGRVVDVSGSSRWTAGRHMMRHEAGRDLTDSLAAAPHGPEMLTRYPLVGVLQRQQPDEERGPSVVTAILARYPILRRHPHPFSAHFPIVFSLCASFFSMLTVITRSPSFDATVLYCLIGCVVFIPFSILTGFFTWWVNYMAKPMRAVRIKQKLSVLAFVFALTALVWKLQAPDLLIRISGAGILCYAIILALGPLALTIGYYGATLTFPIEKEE